jgi:hypothetical protein
MAVEETAVEGETSAVSNNISTAIIGFASSR